MMFPKNRYEAETQKWRDLVYGNGGTVNDLSMGYLDTTVRALKQYGLFKKLRMWNPVMGNNINSMVVPLVRDVGSIIHTNNAIVAADYAENLGVKTDGGTKYINTGFAPDAAPTMGISCYLRTAVTGTVVMIGCRDSGTTQVYRIIRSGTTSGGAIGGTSLATVSDVANTPAAFYHGVRGGSTSNLLYRNGAQVGTESTSTTPAGNSSQMYVLCQNSSAGANSFLPINSYIAGYGVDDGTMTATDVLNYYNAIQALQTSLGRQV